jgi:hypothetical protein
MREALIIWLPWVMSAATVYTMLLAGNKSPLTWTVALVSQCVWLVWIVASLSWGLLPGHFVLWWVYVRNYQKWRVAA